MYCIHSNNVDAFDVLLEFNADLLWKNNTGANIMQLLAKKGLVKVAEKCWERLKAMPESDRRKFINNQSYNGKEI